ncbi:MAG: TonB C-terminal domain-containing protein [Acidobacteriota bacterium]|nr:TonB C-terminal domain-containing protein [Acidobacteriota bacterium]
MYFNFEDYRPDTPTLPRSLTRLEVVLLTIVIYLSGIILILVSPHLPWVKAWEAARQQAVAEQQKQELQRQRDNARFVFMAPQIDKPAPKPPPRAELSDIDRKAATVERAPKPANDMPFSRGNTIERMEAGRPPAAPPEALDTAAEQSAKGMTFPESPDAVQARASDAPQPSPRGPSAGVIADAIRNVQKYAQNESFGNVRGGGNMDFAPSIQFDSKGVDFGPWLRRFIAQIRRNWIIPMAAMTMHGHVAVTFYVGKDGRITELRVLKPSSIDGFNNSSFNALAASNPTQPLPAEYPDDRAFFTITFYYNETPGS